MMVSKGGAKKSPQVCLLTGTIAKDKSDAFIPAIKVVRERKISVAPEPHFSENRLDPVDFQSSLASLCSYEIPLSP
jgi:hypothetical protein